MMFDLSTPRELRPVSGSRRPEAMAWAFALVMLAATQIAPEGFRSIVFGTWALAVYFGLSAVVMTAGNWLERHTRLRLDATGVELVQPGRTTRLVWSEIDRVEVRHSAHGSRVFVGGDAARFSFRTLADIKIRDKIRDRYGFEDSDTILETILERSALNRVRKELANGYLYTRD